MFEVGRDRAAAEHIVPSPIAGGTELFLGPLQGAQRLAARLDGLVQLALLCLQPRPPRDNRVQLTCYGAVAGAEQALLLLDGPLQLLIRPADADQLAAPFRLIGLGLAVSILRQLILLLGTKSLFLFPLELALLLSE
ncbi:hypothetical protein FLT15_18515 [Paenibacillus thiaminolyticus]|uniref:hypothetical protein n=1 Tax=Paenibacillus thiaminolyticus TaxID=49283 RepID=UPI0011634367|nr:hypothetical protein [Paenibacillus thiaminolyticus]NGP60248.1 hypothetical protein [Paenibacillus thiaminolyticus]